MKKSIGIRALSFVFALLFFFFAISHGHEVQKDPLTNVEKTNRRCLQSEGYFTCRDHTQCLHMDQVCDGKKDCTDNSDEDGLCHVRCTPTKCPYSCHSTPLGPYCLCPPGRKLDSDNVTCSDIDECTKWPPSCDQLCTNSLGSFTCSCAPGYSLTDDLVHCYASLDQPGKALLIYAQGSNIMKIAVGHGAASMPSVVHHGRATILSLAMDMKDERVFWFSEDDNEIKAIGMSDDFNKNSLQRIVTNGLLMVNSMSFDYMARNLFIADVLLHRILVCSVDTGICAALFSSNIVHEPRSLTVDPVRRKLYWSECGTSNKIQSSSLDGLNIVTLVRDDVLCPNNLYIDQPVQTLYWADPKQQLIESASTNGSNRRNLLSTYIPHPVGLAIFEEDVYVAYLDRTGNKISMAVTNKFNFEGSRQQMLLQLPEIPVDMQIYHSALQVPQGDNPCRLNPCRGGICLLKDSAGYKCACPVGKRLDSNQHDCIWSLSEPSVLVSSGNQLLRIVPDAVGSASHQVLVSPPRHNITALAYDSVSQTIFFAETVVSGLVQHTSLNSFRLSDMSDVKRLVQDVGRITNIAVDWVAQNIYWVNSKQCAVYLARLDGTSRTAILKNEHVQQPVAIAVDPLEGKLYFSDCGPLSRIGVCDLAGEKCVTQSLGMQPGCVSDLLVDPQPKAHESLRRGVEGHDLYWTDSTVGLIAVTDLIRFQASVLRHSPEPVSFAMLRDSIFWVDTHYGDILKQSTSYPFHETRIKLGLKPLTALVALDDYLQPHESNDCSGAAYGGCSHLCIAKTRLHSICLCPTSFDLGPDQKTCVPNKNNSVSSSETDSDIFDINKLQDLEKSGRPRITGAPLSPNLFQCPPGQCFNNAKCEVRNGQYVCRCAPGWTGRVCDTPEGSLVSPTPSSSQTSYAWVAGVVVIVILLLIGLAIGLFCRSHSRLRPGEVFRFVRLKSSFLLRNDKDPKREKLINATSCPDMVDNIYTDVNDIDETKPPKGRSGLTLVHSQSLDSVQSAGTAELEKQNRNLL
jgi:hypothetical protein